MIFFHLLLKELIMHVFISAVSIRFVTRIKRYKCIKFFLISNFRLINKNNKINKIMCLKYHIKYVQK